MTYQSINPFSGEPVETYDEMSDQELDAAIRQCAGAFSCDCRGVGDTWEVADLRRISAALHGFRLAEVPTTMRDRGRHATSTKKGGNLGYGVRFARAAVHTWRRDRKAARTRERTRRP